MPEGTHYGDTSIKEDVTDIIYQITPEDTPFFNMIGDTTAMQPNHQWQVRDLSTRNDNAQIEGAAYVLAAPVLPTRVNNLTQIIQKTATVSGTSQASSRYAISNLVSDQIEQRMVEYKTDFEHALLRGSTASGNASAIARRMDGLLNVISSNGTAFASGLTLVEVDVNDLLQDIWDAGGKPKDLLVNGTLKRRVSSFTGGAQKEFQQTERKIVRTIAIYESDFAIVSVQLSRDIPTGTNEEALVALDRDMFAKGWLRPTTVRRIAEVSDSIDNVIMGEATLEFGNEAAAGLITAAN